MPAKDPRPAVPSWPKVFKRSGTPDELQAERRVGIWVFIFLVLIAVIYLGVKLASRDINSGGPTIESYE